MKIKSLKHYLQNLTEDTPTQTASGATSSQTQATQNAIQSLTKQTPAQKQKKTQELKKTGTSVKVVGAVGNDSDAETVNPVGTDQTTVKAKKTGKTSTIPNELLVPVDENFDYSKIKFPTI